MPPMPYHYEKGPVLSLLESYMNDDQARAGLLLDGLRAGTHLYQLGFLENPQTNDPNGVVSTEAHVYRDWFGWVEGPPGTWNPPAPAGGPLKPTGYWTAFNGDVEHIIRCAFTRALETSLGVPHVEPHPSYLPQPVVPCVPNRHWPIDVQWKCAQAWFEGWVMWRKTATGGHVDLVLAAPGTGAPLLSDLTAGKPGVANPPGQLGAATDPQGMWVVGHQKNLPTQYHIVTDLPSGDWSGFAIMPLIKGTGAVITWQLAEADGGVLPNGRVFA
jgi:hypothetical protein